MRIKVPFKVYSKEGILKYLTKGIDRLHLDFDKVYVEGINLYFNIIGVEDKQKKILVDGNMQIEMVEVQRPNPNAHKTRLERIAEEKKPIQTSPAKILKFKE